MDLVQDTQSQGEPVRRLWVIVQGKEFEVCEDNGHLSLQQSPEASGLEIAPGVFSLLVNGEAFRVVATRDGASFAAQCAGAVGHVTVESERDRLLKRHSAAASVPARKAEIRAPMPALVVRVEVRAGDSVSKGAGLVVLEAMKMENELRAPQDGVVKKVLVEKGMKVEKGELLLVLD
jgi:biotin carboxyl carrier protein